MAEGTRDGRSGAVWVWLAPSLLLLCGMAAWGALRYPYLPGRVPSHVGPGGVDAWTDKTLWAAFVPVLVYAGLTAALAGSAALSARITPLDEMSRPEGRRSAVANSLTNRPASAASARRTARALLMMNALYGVALVPLCWVQWRTAETAAIPGWVLPTSLALFVLGLVPLGDAWRRDAAEKKAGKTA
ncbi:DUF1648 domain-containing protein [Streptomyces sp. WMMB 714]|uniref:DUF1648 domain-containing protein n=1 Tax=Streptomyces sp. WMMB 714 TaxID=1286822 RepID=UPI000695FC75|nr:DUF1648 domain-containing protein [Streptomyces sp. WMMB 714]